MRVSEAVLWVDAILLTGAIGWALIVAYIPSPNYVLLRKLFWVIAIGVGIFILVWDVTATQSAWVRMLFVALASAAIGVFVAEGTRWTYRGALSHQSHIQAIVSPQPEKEATATNEPHQQLEETPLPPNAKFRYKDKIFWAISRPYTKDETKDLRLAFREIYDCINSHSEPIIANYDGPAPMFTREWLSIIEKQGTVVAIQKLTEIRTKVRFAAIELQDIVKRRPYFSDEIRGMIDDKGETGIMNGSLDDYIEALKSIPHRPGQQLIKLAVGNSEGKFETAIKTYSEWIGRFNNKMMVAKDDLDRLMTIE